jgi:phage shock protein PspC (stress-responsive transcriptional regulator)
MELKRSRHDRWLLGVCGGIARRYGMSSNMVRLGMVVLAIAIPGPSSLLALVVYFIAGTFIPQEETF